MIDPKTQYLNKIYAGAMCAKIQGEEPGIQTVLLDYTSGQKLHKIGLLESPL
jgi:hypothetical protein